MPYRHVVLGDASPNLGGPFRKKNNWRTIWVHPRDWGPFRGKILSTVDYTVHTEIGAYFQPQTDGAHIECRNHGRAHGTAGSTKFAPHLGS
ncbi:hypothetical protein SLA2020_278870 [Shorea laevis]